MNDLETLKSLIPDDTTLYIIERKRTPCNQYVDVYIIDCTTPAHLTKLTKLTKLTGLLIRALPDLFKYDHNTCTIKGNPGYPLGCYIADTLKECVFPDVDIKYDYL